MMDGDFQKAKSLWKHYALPVTYTLWRQSSAPPPVRQSVPPLDGVDVKQGLLVSFNGKCHLVHHFVLSRGSSCHIPPFRFHWLLYFSVHFLPTITNPVFIFFVWPFIAFFPFLFVYICASENRGLVFRDTSLFPSPLSTYYYYYQCCFFFRLSSLIFVLFAYHCVSETCRLVFRRPFSSPHFLYYYQCRVFYVFHLFFFSSSSIIACPKLKGWYSGTSLPCV